MLHKVYVEGFRSLDGFAIDLKPGLNVLVGPNGGGKTNILALFSFISALAENDIGSAINSSGGASKVFRKTGKTSFVDEISIIAQGEFPHGREDYLPPAYERKLLDYGFVSLKYEWSFTLNSSLGYDEVFYSKQALKIKVITKNLFSSSSRDNEWDIEIRSVASSAQAVQLYEVINDSEVAGLLHNRGVIGGDEKSFLPDDDDASAANLPLFLTIRAFLLRSIYTGTQGGATFNFDPFVCKQPNDSAQSPNLEKNGNGLAATIYAIQKSRANPARSMYMYSPSRTYGPNTAKTLQSYFRLLNSSVSEVLAVNNPFDNKVVVQFSVESEGETVDFPLELASDGTVKWLAFTVALLTRRAGFAIEEPENFLHPDVQRQAIELVRTETDGAQNLYVLMTTYSETLLNAARPEELIIVSMHDGVTSAKRVDDPKLIDEEIRSTGFGLGYYYISGALND